MTKRLPQTRVFLAGVFLWCCVCVLCCKAISFKAIVLGWRVTGCVHVGLLCGLRG